MGGLAALVLQQAIRIGNLKCCTGGVTFYYSGIMLLKRSGKGVIPEVVSGNSFASPEKNR